MKNQVAVAQGKRMLRIARTKARKRVAQKAAIEKRFSVVITHQSAPENPYWQGEQHDKFHFLVNITQETKSLSVYLSQASKTPIGRLGYYEYYDKIIALRTENNAPDWGGLLDCLLSDSQGLDLDFEDWCVDLGYNQDSRKALTIWEECQKQGKKFKAIFDLEEVEKYLEENNLR